MVMINITSCHISASINILLLIIDSKHYNNLFINIASCHISASINVLLLVFDFHSNITPRYTCAVTNILLCGMGVVTIFLIK